MPGKKKKNKRSLILELLDIFSVDFKFGIGIDASFIIDVGIDIFSQNATISTSGYSEYYTQGFSSGIFGYSNSTTSTPAVRGFHEDGNATVSIGPVNINEEETDVVVSFGGQIIIGVYINISGKETIEFMEKLYETVHK